MDIKEKIARISDILEQIQKLDDLLTLLKKEEGGASSIRQYEQMKKEFIEELRVLMIGFNLKVEPIEKAA